LRGYRLNNTICTALGLLIKQHYDVNSPFLIRSLILEDNCIGDLELSNLLQGIVR